MRYNISSTKATDVPEPGNKTESIKILLSQASKDMHEPLVPMLFPSLGAHMSGTEFQYLGLILKDSCGLMAYLVHKKGVLILLQAKCRFTSSKLQVCLK